MGLTRGYLISLLLVISVVNEIHLPLVTCQDEEGNRCLPRKTLFALLRLPEVSSNLAAYSRTARINQDARSLNDIVNLKALSTEDGDDTEICIPAGVYLELFSDPAMRGHLGLATGRTQKMLDDPRTNPYYNEAVGLDDPSLESEKRSVAMLAKNDDLPMSIQGKREEENDDERRSFSVLDKENYFTRDDLEDLLNENKRNLAALARDYALPNGKRNVGSLARDFALPSSGGNRNADLPRDFELLNEKRNVGTLARDYMLPSGKRDVDSLVRFYVVPSSEKRNVASLARDYAFPLGKRYLGSLVRTGVFPFREYDNKRSIASLVRNGNMPMLIKRNVGTLARDGALPTQNRYGRSLDYKSSGHDRYGSAKEELLNLQHLGQSSLDDIGGRKISDTVDTTDKPSFNSEESRGSAERTIKTPKKVIDEKRPKRQIDFSDEYPLPVMQNTNVLDYDELIEALAREYSNTEKRFMGTDPVMEMQNDDTAMEYIDVPSKRHIGALARLGWLPSFRAARFSRSPRYLVNRSY